MRRLCLAVLIAVFVSLAGRPASASAGLAYRGSWWGGSIVGQRLVQPACMSWQWTERAITLNQLPGAPDEFRGTTVEHFQAIWTVQDSSACRWRREPAFAPLYDALLTGSLTGHLDPATGQLNVKLSRTGCQGLACDDARMIGAEAEFEMKLHVKDGALVAETPSGQPLTYERVGAYAGGLDSASRTADRVHRTFDTANDDPSALMQLNLLFVDGVAPPLPALGSVRQHVGTILERDARAALLAYGPAVGHQPGGVARSAMLITHCASANGLGGVELLVLQEEPSGWRISWLQFI